MEFVVGRIALQKALQNVAAAMNTRSSVHLLSCVKISAQEGKLSLVTTNLETEAGDKIECTMSKAGEIAAPLSTLLEVVKSMTGDKLECKLEETGTEGAKKLIVSHGSDVMKVTCLSADEFPEVLSDKFDVENVLESKAFAELMKKTIFSISNNPDRYNLNGLLLQTVQKDDGIYLRAVSTDGHRLSMDQIKIKGETGVDAKMFTTKIVVPRKSIAEMAKLLNQDEKECTISVSSNKLALKIGSTSFCTKLMDVEFPDYEKVVPQKNDKIMEVKKSDLTAALGRVNVIYTIKGIKGVKCIVDGKKSQLTLTCTNQNGDEASAVVECKFSDSEEKFETAYNPQFVSDILSNLTEKEVRFSFSTPTAPLLIKPEDKSDSCYVVMPMRI